MSMLSRNREPLLVVKNKVAVDGRVTAARCGSWDTVFMYWAEEMGQMLVKQVLSSEFESSEPMFKNLGGDRRISGTC